MQWLAVGRWAVGTSYLTLVLVMVWIIPGYAGLVAGPIYGILLIEALVRWRRARPR